MWLHYTHTHTHKIQYIIRSENNITIQNWNKTRVRACIISQHSVWDTVNIRTRYDQFRKRDFKYDIVNVGMLNTCHCLFADKIL